MRIVILIRSLALAGAERQAMLTARGLVARGHHVWLVLLRDDNGHRSELEAAGVSVVCLDNTSLATVLRTILRLVRLLRSVQPTAVYGFMDGPNALVSTIARVVPKAVRACGLRASELARSDMPWLARVLYRLEPFLARGSDLVIVNSSAGFASAQDRGFPAQRLRLIPNGIDTTHFQRDDEQRADLRQALGVGADEVLIGRVGRFHQMKGYDTFIDSLVHLRAQNIRFRALCVGAGELEKELREWAADAGVAPMISWLPPRRDLRGVYSACDVVVSSSRYGEGLPNVVAEAMSCDVPCVVTDVGDSATVVGDTGVVVRPDDPRSIAAGIQRVLRSSSGPGSAGSPRRRIIDRYSLERMISDTEAALLGEAR